MMKLMKVLIVFTALALVLPAVASADTIYVDEYDGNSTGSGTGTGAVVTYSSTTDAITGGYAFSQVWTSAIDDNGNLWVTTPNSRPNLGELASGGSSITTVRVSALNQYQLAMQGAIMPASTNPTIFFGSSQGGQGEVSSVLTNGNRGQSVNQGVPINKGYTYGVACDQAGNMYAVTNNATFGSLNVLVELPSGYTSGTLATWLASNGTVSGTTGIQGTFFPTGDMVLQQAVSLAFDPKGNLWSANQFAYSGEEDEYTNYGTDVGNWGIAEFTGSGTFWNFAGPQVLQLTSSLVDANGMNEVQDIQFDREGDLWVLCNNSDGSANTALYEITNPSNSGIVGIGGVAATILLNGVDANYFSILNYPAAVQPTVPEPISMIFFGTGLVAVSGYIARRKMQKA